jgi:hypothetical protein
MTLARSRSTRTAFVVAAILAGSVTASAATVSVPGTYPTIQAAINAVLNGTQPNGSTIDVQPGTYAEALTIGNTSASLTIRAAGGPVVVDAAGRGTAAISIQSATGQIVIQGLTFRHGTRSAGGGFFIQSSSPTFKSCIFENNTGYDGAGGALFSSNATFSDCVIRNNVAQHFAGGVFIVNGSKPVFTRCDIVTNQSGTGGSGVGNNGAGGGVFSLDSSPSFRWSRIIANSSRFASGGVHHQGVFGSASGHSRLMMEDTDITDNVSTQFPGEPNPSEGGGMHVEDNATATLLRVRILRNQAGTGAGLNAYRGRFDVFDSSIESNQATAGFGGGIAGTSNFATPSAPGSNVNLTRTLVRNNTAPLGGGIALVGDNFSAEKATLTLNGSIVSGNLSQSQGGGILANRTTVTSSNSLIINNSVAGGANPYGGGILAGTFSSLTISTTTIAHNTAGQHGGGIFLNDNSTISMTGSNVYDNTAGTRGGGLFIGAFQTGTVSNNVIADNVGQQLNAQINEDACSSVQYPNNLITPTLFSGGCGSLSSRAPGTDSSSPPRFGHFLAAPTAGVSMTLGWSVARATAVNIPGAVSNSNQRTSTVDVSPSWKTTYSMTASAPSGAIGPASATVYAGPAWGSPGNGDMPVVADFDGDGKADIGVYRLTSGDWFVIKSSTSTMLQVNWGAPQLGDTPVIADYDGDGKADVAVYRLSTGDWFVIRSTNSTMLQVNWGAPQLGDTPVVGDYDGDGKADVAVYRLTTGQWFVIRSSNSTLLQVGWGAPNLGDVPVVGDYDGDGKSDVGVYRQSSGQWFIIRSSNNTLFQVAWGAPSLGDMPVPADYDGDGKTDVAVVRGATGEWFLRYSSGGSNTVNLGVGDARVAADYDGNGIDEPTVWGGASGRWLSR